MCQICAIWQPASEANMDPPNNLLFLAPFSMAQCVAMLVMQPHLSKNPGSGPAIYKRMWFSFLNSGGDFFLTYPSYSRGGLSLFLSSQFFLLTLTHSINPTPEEAFPSSFPHGFLLTLTRTHSINPTLQRRPPPSSLS